MTVLRRPPFFLLLMFDACYAQCVPVTESEARYYQDIPVGDYPNVFLPPNTPYSMTGTSVKIQPPEVSDGMPYPYGATYSLCRNSPGVITRRNLQTATYEAVFRSEGIFHAIVDGAFTTIFVGESAVIDREKDKKGKTGCTEEFKPSDAELVISADTNDQRLDYYRDELKQKVVLVTNVREAVMAVKAHVKKNGKLKKLTIAEHGFAGQISVGDGKERIAGAFIQKTETNAKLGAYQELVRGLKGQFQNGAELCLVACNVGDGVAGQNLVDCLAKDLHINVRAKRGTVWYPLRWYLFSRYAASSGEKGWATAKAPHDPCAGLPLAGPKGQCWDGLKCIGDPGQLEFTKKQCCNGGFKSWMRTKKEGDKKDFPCCNFTKKKPKKPKDGQGKKGANGDPHFVPWSDIQFDYHGECDLILHRSAKADMDVHIRTTIVVDEFSYIESAAVRLGDDVLVVSSFGDYSINGVSGATLPHKLGGKYHWEHIQHDPMYDVFLIELDDGQGMKISTLKHYLRVELDFDNEDQFGDSQGMMGNFTTKGLFGRDGTTRLGNHYAFADEWQVRDTDPQLFETKRAPQHPEKCSLPKYDAGAGRVGRRLGEGLARKAAEEACAHWPTHKNMCVYDLLATGDVDIARYPL